MYKYFLLKGIGYSNCVIQAHKENPPKIDHTRTSDREINDFNKWFESIENFNFFDKENKDKTILHVKSKYISDRTKSQAGFRFNEDLFGAGIEVDCVEIKQPMEWEGDKAAAYFKDPNPQPNSPETKPTKKEFIICAANHYDDGKKHTHCPKNVWRGFVTCGRRHHNCISTFAQIVGFPYSPESQKLHNTEVQGFLTNTNRFVDRKEAYTIAFNADQIIGPNKGCPTNLIGLTSEDLY